MSDQLEKAPPLLQGDPVKVVRTRRSMKHYTVFDSDFESLATQEVGVSVSLTLSSFCFALWLDIFKDTMFAQNIPTATEAALQYIQPSLILFGILFAISTAMFWQRKRSTIQKIKDDCEVMEVEEP
jgi:hypothetical protein